MKLSIKDRFAIQTLFPRQSGLLEQIMARDIQKKIEITQIETKKINLRSEENRLVWDNTSKDIDVEFSQSELEFLKNQINRLDKDKQILPEMVDVCLKIKEEKCEKAK